jgi:hypothetical protein
MSHFEKICMQFLLDEYSDLMQQEIKYKHLFELYKNADTSLSTQIADHYKRMSMTLTAYANELELLIERLGVIVNSIKND